MKTILFLFLTLLFISCSKKETLPKEDFISRLKTANSSLIVTTEKTTTCAQYEKGCLNIIILKLEELQFIAIEFDSIQSATYQAKKIKGFRLENWVLDDVRGEPILERFATHGIQAEML